MRRFPLGWLLASALLIAVGLSFGCSSGGSGSNDLTEGLFGAQGGGAIDGFSLTADPTEVVIDTASDPLADSGQTSLTAIVLEDEGGQPLEGVEVIFSTDAGTLASAGAPVLTGPDGTAVDTLTVALADPDSIVVTAVEGSSGREESVEVTKVVILANQPPVADAGAGFAVPCDSSAGSTVTLDGSGSSDPDSTPGTNDDIESFEWFEDYQTPDETALGEGMTLDDILLAFGTHVITLVVTDSEGLSDAAEVTIEIVDETAPQVTASVDPDMLWPPNHQWVDVAVTLSVDDCSPTTVVLDSATSSEPENGTGDGDTAPDIDGVDGGEDYELRLRAERAGGGPGRVYTLTYLVTDASGLGTEVALEVVVPHDQSGR